MKKALNTTHITNELEGASAFFSRPTSLSSSTPDIPQERLRSTPQETLHTSISTRVSEEASVPQEQVNTEENSKLAQLPASMLASYQDSMIEAIRKTVKDIGKEVTFVRLTIEEKRELSDIVYTYKRQGVKTSENEISRIAINYVLEDYKINGHTSMLASVIAALLA